MRSFVLALTLASATVAAAQPAADDLAEARGAFEAGQSAYRAGRFEDALGSFRLAFSITDAPEILFNIATVLDRLRRDDEALSAYRTFLELRPDTPERANIEGRIQALERAREREQRERAAEEAAALARVNTAAAEAARQAFEEAEAQRAPAGPGAGPWVVGGIGGALVLASGVFFGLYFADASTVEDVESPSRFEDIQDAYARAPVYAGVGWSTAIGGALILGSAIAWAALAGGRDSEEGQGSVALVVGPAHLGLCGSFPVRRGVAGLVLAGVLGCQPQPPEGALICTLMADGTEEGCPSAFTCVAPRGDTVGRCYRFPERVDAGTALDAGPPPVFDAGAGDGGAEGDGGPDAGAGDAGIDAGVAAPGIPVDFALGPSHSCALYADGRAFCWGDNVEGQLGRGTQTVTPSTSAAPVIGMPDGALQIEAGTRGNCLRTAEAIHCWGDRVSFFTPGILGVADLANVTQPTEVTLIGEEPPVGLAVGGDHACAIVGPTRSLQCWGFNGNGQLGINSLADQDTPQIVAGISGVEELCAGADHTCARLDDGTVSCWGATSEGLLGIGETMEERVLVPTPVPGLTEVTRLFCGLRHNCALVDDGGTTELRCWGGNEDGEAGNESGLFLEPVRSPRTVSLGPSTPEESLAEIEEMALGGRNVLIFGFRGFSLMWGAELALHAMGADDVGQLGRGVGSGTPPEEPALVSSLPRAILFADAGDAHACAAVEDGGETSVVCWGWNSRGQLGNTTQTDSRVPVAVVGLPLR